MATVSRTLANDPRVFTYSIHVPRNNPAGKDVVAEIRAKGFEPEGYTLYSYAAMQIMKQAAEK